MAVERRRGCMDWLLYDDIDWETLTSKPKEYSPGIAGALFGAGWWCWWVLCKLNNLIVRVSA